VSIPWKDEINGHIQDSIRAILEDLLVKWNEFSERDMEPRTGFVCTIADAGGRDMLMPQLFIGDQTRHEVLSTAYVSLRKAMVLMDNNHFITTRPLASPNPQDLLESERVYAGGIRVRNIVIAISGLPWQGDQSVACALGYWLGLVTIGDVQQIARESADNNCVKFLDFVS
jgi:hypothetical protein